MMDEFIKYYGKEPKPTKNAVAYHRWHLRKEAWQKSKEVYIDKKCKKKKLSIIPSIALAGYTNEELKGRY